MSKARKCDWCGEPIGKTAARVRLPSVSGTWSMTYHAKCYVQVHEEDCRDWLAEQDAEREVAAEPETPEAHAYSRGFTAGRDSADADYTAATSEQIAEAMIRGKARGFSGIDPAQYRAGWSDVASSVLDPPQPCRRINSREVEAIRLLDELDDAARERVLDYWQGRREQEGCDDIKGAGA